MREITTGNRPSYVPPPRESVPYDGSFMNTLTPTEVSPGETRTTPTSTPLDPHPLRCHMFEGIGGRIRVPPLPEVRIRPEEKLGT